MQIKHLSSETAVLLEIKQLTEKRDYLRLLCSLTEFESCAFMFYARNRHNVQSHYFVRQEHFPFNMEQEFRMFFEDAIANINHDIATLNHHLKNI
jgi:hypothetical protein